MGNLGCWRSDEENTEDPNRLLEKLNKVDANEAMMEAEIMAMMNPTSTKRISETMQFFIMPDDEDVETRTGALESLPERALNM